MLSEDQTSTLCAALSYHAILFGQPIVTSCHILRHDHKDYLSKGGTYAGLLVIAHSRLKVVAPARTHSGIPIPRRLALHCCRAQISEHPGSHPNAAQSGRHDTHIHVSFCLSNNALPWQQLSWLHQQACALQNL